MRGIGAGPGVVHGIGVEPWGVVRDMGAGGETCRGRPRPTPAPQWGRQPKSGSRKGGSSELGVDRASGGLSRAHPTNSPIATKPKLAVRPDALCWPGPCGDGAGHCMCPCSCHQQQLPCNAPSRSRPCLCLCPSGSPDFSNCVSQAPNNAFWPFRLSRVCHSCWSGS